MIPKDEKHPLTNLEAFRCGMIKVFWELAIRRIQMIALAVTG